MRRLANGLLFIIFYLSSSLVGAQPLTLVECMEAARQNYPLIMQYQLVDQSRDFTMQNAAKGWLPRISASAGAYAFTDLLDMPDGMGALVGDMKNRLLTASVQVSQTLYDGGSIAAQKRVVAAQADVDRERLNVSLYDVNDRVQQLFFGILLLDAQIEQSLLLQADLKLGVKTVESMQRGGLANQSDADAVNVQLLSARQQELALRASRHAYMQMLGTFIGRGLTDQTQLDAASLSRQVPPTVAPSYSLRPEMQYYNAQLNLLDQQHRQLNTQLMPRLSAFGLGMYHSKITSMVNNGTLAAGLQLSWNIGALYTRKNDLAKLQVQRQGIESQRATFLFNNRLQSENTSGAISSLQQQIALDDEIILLRENIRSKSEAKVQLGTETVNEMLRDINAVSEARQARALHEIQLLHEVYNLKHINNWEE